ncbi:MULTISPECIES: S41 family peptidase [unclassified Sphingobacterium]|uniref:S41 family peptidase n=1 Tax=unclassified Sphingobacterium TaxID=2609468 RepID=UPI00104C09F5|nr:MULTISPECIES: S41 family peptidase [unclassified Sphingobacterium]MCS3552734.1 C-terminal processing protease CtpA/Prc [Sphingobacterium sp. JUb21]TCR10508.1 C-terminal processing protease CtpA/Prc [Sphingobacterium sp. JUb20]
MFKAKFSLFICIILCVQTVCAQDNQRFIDRLMMFAKLAGNIEYFSPTDQVAWANRYSGWDHIYINGIEMANKLHDEDTFTDSLIRIFKPLEPSLFVTDGKKIWSHAEHSQKSDLVISKQQIGLDLLSGTQRGFKSIRLNRRSEMSDIDLFEVPILNVEVPSNGKDRKVTIDIQYQVTDQQIKMALMKNWKTLHVRPLSSSDSTFELQFTIPADQSRIAIHALMDLDKKISVQIASFMIDGKKIALTSFDDGRQTDSLTFMRQMKISGNDSPLFEAQNQIGDTLHFALSKNVTASFPLAVYGDYEHTYPKATMDTYPYVKSSLQSRNDSKAIDNRWARLANVIRIWNVFRIAYVYNTFTDQEQDQLLRNTLSKMLNVSSSEDYYDTIWQMLAQYKDSHIFFSMDTIESAYKWIAPLTVMPLEGNFYIKKIHDKALASKVSIGDEVIAVDNKPIEEVTAKFKNRTSGSEANRMLRTSFFVLSGKEGSDVTLKLRNHKNNSVYEIVTKRTFQEQNIFQGSTFVQNRNNRLVDSNIYYFDYTQSGYTDTLLRFIDDPSKTVIFDLRGYISMQMLESSMISKLLRDTVVAKSMYGLQILSPDKKEFVSDNDTYIPENRGPKAQFFFLADASTQSAPESFLDIMKYGHIGKIIGTPTSGANGTINNLDLIGNTSVTFSGVKVLNSDGMQHHLIGVKPDYYIDYTLNDILSGRDPMLEKAISLAKERNIKSIN